MNNVKATGKVLDDYCPNMLVVERYNTYKLTNYKWILPSNKRDSSEYNLTIFDLDGTFIDNCKFYPKHVPKNVIRYRTYYCPKRNVILCSHGILYTTSGIYQRFTNMSDRNHPTINILADNCVFDKEFTVDMLVLHDLIVVAS